MKEEIRELDRNMDTAFDSLFVLNTAVNAIISALPQESARQVVQSLDAGFDELLAEKRAFEPLCRETLLGWRNAAARLAGYPRRHRPA